MHTVTFRIFRRLVGNRQFHVECTIYIMAVQIGNRHNVADMYFGSGGKIYRTNDSRHAEHVLRFKKRAVATAINLHRHTVCPFYQIFRYVELRKTAGIFGEPHIFAVYPEIEKRIHAVEVYEHPEFFPIGGNVETANVLPHLVAVFVCRPCLGRFAHHSLAPITYLNFMIKYAALVHINGNAVFAFAVFANACHIPRRRYFYFVPFPRCRLIVFETFYPFIGICRPMKLPVAVERGEKVAVCRQNFFGSLCVLKRKEPRMGQFLVERQLLGRLPFAARWRRHITVHISVEMLCGSIHTHEQHSRKQYGKYFILHLF